MRPELLSKKYSRIDSIVEKVVDELSDSYGLMRGNHFLYVLGELRTPLVLYVDLAAEGKEFSDERFNVSARVLFAYLRLLKQYPAFAKDELLEQKGHFPLFVEQPASVYIKHAAALLENSSADEF